ncbi:hypothetical protein GQ600_19065 [Phytophthora cactorum]|nr:hypothetical protein GQ600_19065 [Phytophthora cactorum]
MLDCTFADVLVQYPDDVVYLNNLVQHSVLLGYQPETAEIDKWGQFWRSYSHRKGSVDSFTYATKIASGSRRGSKDAWVALLSAYCVMEGREWHDANYKEEKRMFLGKTTSSRRNDSSKQSRRRVNNIARSLTEDRNVNQR